MFLDLVEVYEVHDYNGGSQLLRTFGTRNVVVNVNSIAFIRAAADVKDRLERLEKAPEGLSKEQQFTRLSLARGQAGQDIVVIGAVEDIKKRLHIGNRQLLND